MDGGAAPAHARELIAWGQTFAEDASRVLAAVAELDTLVQESVLALADETQKREGQRSSLQAAPRFDLTPHGLATKKLATALRRRERLMFAYPEAIALARQVVADLEDAMRTADSA